MQWINQPKIVKLFILNYILRKYGFALPILFIVAILTPLVIIIKLRKCIIDN